MWDAPIFFPYRDTLAFSENLFGIAFFVAPVYWISGNPLLTYNVAFLLSFVLAGVGMYLLARELTGSAAAALVAAVFYAFFPFRLAQIAHLQMMATGGIPIALWAMHRYFATRARRWLLVLGVAWIAQTLSNSYVGYFLFLPGIAVAVHGIVTGANRRRLIVDLAVTGLLVAAILLPVAAAYGRARSTYHLVRDPAEIAAHGADVRSYFVGKQTIGVWRWLPTAVITDPEKELFPGFVGLLLAAVALWRRDRTALLYGGIALAAFLFSLGPRVQIWRYVLTDHGPYAWLLSLVPAMDAMRVPARFAIIVFAALAVVAGCGARLLLARVSARAQPIVLALCLIAIVSEGWAVPLPTAPYPARGRPDDRAVASWLQDRPPGAVLHLPLTAVPWMELHYQYATLFHQRPIVNGFSGYSAPLQDMLRESSSPLTDFARFDATLAMLRSLGIRYIVVHADDYAPASRDPQEAVLTIDALRTSGQTAAEMRFVQTTAFDLDDDRTTSAPGSRSILSSTNDASPGATPIEPRRFTLSASDALDRLPSLVDGNPDSRWLTGLGGQNGSSWIEARFDQPVNLARLELQLAQRSMTDYPRALRVDVTDVTGSTRTIYDAAPYPELAAAILRDPRYPTLSMTLPPNDALTVTVRQTAPTRRAWSVHELRFWSR